MNNIFTSNITAEGLTREIVCRMAGDRAVAVNDLLNAFRDFPTMQHLMSILLNPMPGQLIMGQELNSAMTELLTMYNRNTENNPNLNPAQKPVGKMANNAFESMAYNSVVSQLRLVSMKCGHCFYAQVKPQNWSVFDKVYNLQLGIMLIRKGYIE